MFMISEAENKQDMQKNYSNQVQYTEPKNIYSMEPAFCFEIFKAGQNIIS